MRHVSLFSGRPEGGCAYVAIDTVCGGSALDHHLRRPVGGIIGTISRFVGGAVLALTASVVYRRLNDRHKGKLICVVRGVV